MDKFAKIINDQLTYVGCLIIKKTICIFLHNFPWCAAVITLWGLFSSN